MADCTRRHMDELIKCDDCKHYIDLKDAQVVQAVQEYMSFPFETTRLYYCPDCRKRYSSLLRNAYGDTKYFAEIEVLQDGTPAGYMRIPKK